MTRADRAEQLFREGYNCCQSVFGAFTDVTGLELKTAMRHASPFGAGFGKLREVCGAVSGMTMVVGYVAGYGEPTDREGKIALYHIVQELAAEFERRQGTIICRDMLKLKQGEDLPEPAVRTEEYYRSRPCISAVRDAAEILDNFLQEFHEEHH
ncbi:C-GCAxxG-C-C family protein [Roseburia hominis]